MNNEISFNQNDLIYGNEIDDFLNTNTNTNTNSISKKDMYQQMFPLIEKQIINSIIDEYSDVECLDIFLQLSDSIEINKSTNVITNQTNDENNTNNDKLSYIDSNTHNYSNNDENNTNNNENNQSQFSFSRLFRRNNKGNYKKVNRDDLFEIDDDL